MASKRELRIVLTTEGEKQYTENMKQVSSALKTVKSEQALLDAEFGKGNASIEKMTRQHKLLEKQLAEQKKRLTAATDAHDKAKKSTKANAETVEELARGMNYAQTSVYNTERAIADLDKQMHAATSRTEKFKAAMKDLGVSAQSIGAGIEKLGQKMTRYITTSVVTGLTASAKMALDYGDALSKLGTLSEAAEYGVGAMSEQILAASNRTGMAATEMTDAVYDTISSGVAAADAVAMVEKASMAAMAGNANLADLIGGTTSILNGWGISADKATDVLERMITAAELGKAEIGDLASNIGAVTGLAPQLGISLDETLASVEALTLNGVDASVAFTGLRAIMSAVLKPSSEATKEAKRLGLEFDVASLRAKGLTGFLADVQEATKGDEESLAKLFGRVEALSSVMALGTSAAQSYSDVLAGLGGSAGSLAEKYGVRMDNEMQRMKVSLNQLKNSAIQLGQVITPYLDVITGGVTQLAEKMAGMTEEERKQAINIALIVAAAGPLLTVMGKIIKNIGSIGKGIKAVAGLVGGGGILSGLTLGLAAAVAGIIAVKSHMDKLAEKQRMTFNLGVDTSALEKIEVDASAVNVVVQNVTISSSGKSLYDEIVKWLSDGLPETPEQVAAMTAKVTDVVGQCYTNIETDYNTKKAALDEKLAAGLIDEATYTGELGNLRAKTTELTTSLDESAAAVTDYIGILVAANAKPTEAQLAYLQQLIDKLVETGQAANEATNAVMAGYEFAYNRANAGQATTPDEYVQAGQYIEINRTAKLTALEGQKAATQAEYGARVAGVAPGSKDYVAATKAYGLELDAINAQIEATNAAADDMWKSLLGGALEGSGITLEALREYVEAQALITETENSPGYKTFGTQGLEDAGVAFVEAEEKVSAFEKAVSEMDTDQLAAVASAMSQFGLPFDGTDATTLLQDIAAFMAGFDEVKQAADEAASEIGDKAEEAGKSNIDRTQSGAATRRNMLRRDMRKTGADSIQGLIDGAESKRGELIAKFKSLMASAEAAARLQLDTHSPSRKFAAIADDTLDGFINRIKSRMASVQKSMSDAVNPSRIMATQPARAQEAGRAALGGDTYNMYYEGSVTARDARKLMKTVAASQRLGARARGS